MQGQQKVNKILIGLIVCLCVYIYINRDSTLENNKMLERLRIESDSLSSANKLLLFDVIALKDSIKINQQQIDSLVKEKSKIVIKYKIKSHEIDKANTAELVSEFDSIFSSANIK